MGWLEAGGNRSSETSQLGPTPYGVSKFGLETRPGLQASGKRGRCFIIDIRGNLALLVLRAT